jgi:hypothetical protein
MDTPELDKEPLISSDQVGKCLRQHPRAREVCHTTKGPLWEYLILGRVRTYYSHYFRLSMRYGGKSTGVYVVPKGW